MVGKDICNQLLRASTQHLSLHMWRARKPSRNHRNVWKMGIGTFGIYVPTLVEAPW